MWTRRPGASARINLSARLTGRPTAQEHPRTLAQATVPSPIRRDTPAERLTFGGGTVLVKSATSAFSVWEELPPLLDAPLRIHEHEDQLFHILEGEHVFECGGDRFDVDPGDFLAVPRGVPHAHRGVLPGAGRFLLMTAPGGFDGFFRMLADADRAGTLGPKMYAEASLRYGSTLRT